MLVEMAEFLSSCPYFEGERVFVNYLGPKMGSYSLERVSGKTEKKLYADGGKLCSDRFILSVRAQYPSPLPLTLEIQERCRNIENWIEKQSCLGTLFNSKICETVISCAVAEKFTAIRSEGNDVRYEAQLEVRYYKE